MRCATAQRKAIIAANVHAGKAARKADARPEIVSQGGTCRDSTNVADLDGRARATAAKPTPACCCLPCGSAIDQNLAHGIDRPMAQRQMCAEAVAIADSDGFVIPAHLGCPLGMVEGLGERAHPPMNPHPSAAQPRAVPLRG